MRLSYWQKTVLEHLVERGGALTMRCSKKRKGKDCIGCQHGLQHGMVPGCRNSCNGEQEHWCFPVEPVVAVSFEQEAP